MVDAKNRVFASTVYFTAGVGTAIKLFGKLVAVLIELPVLMTICWRACQWSRAKFSISPERGSDRLVMSSLAFTLFVVVERTISYFVLEQTLEEFCADYVKSYSPNNPANLLGRLCEVLFGIFPIVPVLPRKGKGKPKAKEE